MWVVDKIGVVGRKIRKKLRQEVKRVVREKRTKPNQKLYNYVGVGAQSVTHTTYYTQSTTELTPDPEEWTEFSAQEYEKLWQSDDDRFSFWQSVADDYSFLLFRFKVDSDKKVVKKAVFLFEGYGIATSADGVTVKVWNFEASEWQNPQNGTIDQD